MNQSAASEAYNESHIMSIKIVLDSNKLIGKNSFGELFGNRQELERINELPNIELLVPQIVIDELIHQKNEAFQVSKVRFQSNSMYKMLSAEARQAMEQVALDTEALRLDVSIPYKMIDVTDQSAALVKIRDLAVNYKAPFQVYNSEDKENSDKGFKDAFIAMTVDDYLDGLTGDEKIFLYTNDGRLAEYFGNNNRVVWVRNYDEIVGQIGEAETVTASEPHTPTIRPQSPQHIEIQNLLTDLRNSGNFAYTHTLISKLNVPAILRRLSDEDYLDILRSTISNEQILWIVQDSDVSSFILPIFEKYKDSLTPHQFNTFISAAGLSYPKRSSQSVDAWDLF